MTVTRLRTPAQAAASRRNGAKSKGPRSELGKNASGQNARKHGLFGQKSYDLAGCSAAIARLAGYVAQLTRGRAALDLLAQQILDAARREEEAGLLLSAMRGELSALLDSNDDGAALNCLHQITRIARYQRRFRGQRDRALRILMREADD